MATLFCAACLATPALAQNYAGEVTLKEWQNNWFSMITARQGLTDVDIDSYISANLDTVDPDVLTFIGLAEIDRANTDLDADIAFLHLNKACDLGQMRACRTFARFEVGLEDTPERASSLKLLGESCDQGINLACDDLAQFYLDKNRGLVNNEKALKYADLACREVSSEPCSNIARSIMYLAPEKATAWLQEACNDSLVSACFHYGKLLTDEQLGNSNSEQATLLFDYSCIRGHYYACDNLFFLLGGENMSVEDSAPSEEVAQNFCLAGYQSMCLRMSQYYLNFRNDDDLAFPMTQQGCALGHIDMCRWLAEDYAKGDGTTQDLETAEALYKRLCEFGDDWSCELAVETSAGSQLLTQPERFLAACNLGRGLSCRDLAWKYVHGEDVDKDLIQAETLFIKGCDLGFASSCLDLGNMRLDATFGMSQDLDQAERLYALGCDSGHKVGCEMVEHVRSLR